jgi:hypothetical protein
LGMYTLSPSAKIVPGEASFPFPANLVVMLEIGSSDGRVVKLCFDSEEELESFKAAVEFGLQCKNSLKAVLGQKDTRDKHAQSATSQLDAENQSLEEQLAYQKRKAALNGALNGAIEAENQRLRLEKQKYDEQCENLRSISLIRNSNQKSDAPEPQPASLPFSEPQPASLPFSEPQPASLPFSEPQPASLPFSEPQPASLPFSEPQPASLPFSEPQPASLPLADSFEAVSEALRLRLTNVELQMVCNVPCRATRRSCSVLTHFLTGKAEEEIEVLEMAAALV